ncbi:hypothetical protein H696_00230 [Fonticula alba]|uniref:Mob1/phocein family protein n=1 Tax=Fonticula alba TaxID=691883 RepID=A0A058ZE56_FONAL|nr:hypothetical protein H696_00230 [Fonticula alba]KCV72649.1 hypothetical protein H696_00230 [Fonticula alba]|eukprot:XP_009492350.1 hypothetical protein H696_00230 [Fonticula alba]
MGPAPWMPPTNPRSQAGGANNSGCPEMVFQMMFFRWHTHEIRVLYLWILQPPIDFFNQLNLIYGSLVGICTASTCATMSAGKRHEYRWADDVSTAKPVRLSAPEYMDRLLSWVQSLLASDTIFPIGLETEYPPDFFDIVCRIFRRLLRIYAHVYRDHLELLTGLNERCHLDACLGHFLLFAIEFRLIDTRELSPLVKVIRSMAANSTS